MKKTRLAFATLSLLGLSSFLQASDWSDTYIGYRYGASFREPVNSEKIPKNIVSLSHVSGYKYGSNFFNVDMLSSNAKNPASGGGGGAHEVYAVYRTTLSGSSVSGTPLKFGGVIRDLGLTAGFDFNAKDDQFAARVFKMAVGPKVSFDVPGFFDIALVLRTEKNHNWFATGTGFGGAGCRLSKCHPDVKFDNTFAVETAWGIPFTVGMPFKFKGFGNYIGAKGKDAFEVETVGETLIEAALMGDVGSFAGKNGALFIGVGYQYWKNKFGNDASLDSTGGAKASVPQLQVEAHF